MSAHGLSVPTEVLVPFATGMIVGFSLNNTIPSVFVAAPDESAFFTVLPGQKFLMAGRGFEAVLVTSVGGLAGLVLLTLVVGPLAPRFLPIAQAVFRPHMHWILWCVICFMLMSEWPKEGRLGQAGWRKFLAGWQTLAAGLITFLLAGFLGFLLLYRSPVSVDAAFQSLMPAFVGLFTAPWLILNIATRVEPPAQKMTAPDLDPRALLHGSVAGALGGGFAAFFPVVTGGVGGFLAGHATAIRDDRAFLISQGASKLVYYAGGFLLFFVPGLHLVRGGGAWMIQAWTDPRTCKDYYMVLGAIAVAGAMSLLMVIPLTQAVIRLVSRWGYCRLSQGALALMVLLVLAQTGWPGMLVMLTGAGIGLIPPLFGSRRMNCLGVILLPMACNMSGIGSVMAGLLGLL
jgi:putative membrane protein